MTKYHNIFIHSKWIVVKFIIIILFYFILTHDVLINELTCEIEVKFCVGLGFHSFFFYKFILEAWDKMYSFNLITFMCNKKNILYFQKWDKNKVFLFFIFIYIIKWKLCCARRISHVKKKKNLVCLISYNLV